MTIQERENAYVNAELQRMALARELAGRYPEIVGESDAMRDLFDNAYNEGAEKAADEHAEAIKGMEADHTDRLEERAEELAADKLRALRARCERAERAAELAWRTRAKARLWDIHQQAGQPLKLTAAQKRSEIWQLRTELKAALERLTALERAEVTDAPSNVVPLRAGS